MDPVDFSKASRKDSDDFLFNFVFETVSVSAHMAPFCSLISVFRCMLKYFGSLVMYTIDETTRAHGNYRVLYLHHVKSRLLKTKECQTSDQTSFQLFFHVSQAEQLSQMSWNFSVFHMTVKRLPTSHIMSLEKQISLDIFFFPLIFILLYSL